MPSIADGFVVVKHDFSLIIMVDRSIVQSELNEDTFLVVLHNKPRQPHRSDTTC
jgi:hypothetical protein